MHCEHWCDIHRRCEPNAVYKVCGECLHGWVNEEEFFKDVAAAWFEYGMGPSAHLIDLKTESCCPHCTHDF